MQRLDKWLWFARVIKSRTLAAQLVEDGKVRVNRARASQAESRWCDSGDVLTIAVRGRVQVAEGAGGRRPPGAARGSTRCSTSSVACQAAAPSSGAGSARGAGRPSRARPPERPILTE